MRQACQFPGAELGLVNGSDSVPPQQLTKLAKVDIHIFFTAEGTEEAAGCGIFFTPTARATCSSDLGDGSVRWPSNLPIGTFPSVRGCRWTGFLRKAVNRTWAIVGGGYQIDHRHTHTQSKRSSQGRQQRDDFPPSQ